VYTANTQLPQSYTTPLKCLNLVPKNAGSTETLRNIPSNCLPNAGNSTALLPQTIKIFFTNINGTNRVKYFEVTLDSQTHLQAITN
jgi:hypothetical protein